MRSLFVALVFVLNPGYAESARPLARVQSNLAPQAGGPAAATPDAAPPDLAAIPIAPAPHQLGTVTLPDTVSAVRALFERLPSAVGGHSRSPELDPNAIERVSVGYGEDNRVRGMQTPLLSLQAIDLSKEGFFPPSWTAGQVVAFMAGQEKDATESGRDGDLVWMRQETFRGAAGSPERFPVHAMLWGRLDSPWIFSIQADARENQETLIEAFIAASSALR